MSVSVANYCADQRSIAYQKKIERSRMKAPIQSSTIGINGLTFKASCDSAVAGGEDKPECHSGWHDKQRRECNFHHTEQSKITSDSEPRHLLGNPRIPRAP